MISGSAKPKQRFRVICIWCGSKIRDDNEKDSTGICLECFYQLLTSHLRMQKRTINGDYVSDR